MSDEGLENIPLYDRDNVSERSQSLSNTDDEGSFHPCRKTNLHFTINTNRNKPCDHSYSHGHLHSNTLMTRKFLITKYKFAWYDILMTFTLKYLTIHVLFRSSCSMTSLCLWLVFFMDNSHLCVLLTDQQSCY
jgi:hypothetical protein